MMDIQNIENLNTDNDVQNAYTCGRLLRKQKIEKKICAKDERNASIKKVSQILQKRENDRTSDELQTLKQYSDAVEEVKSRWKKRDAAKRRIEEFEEPINQLEAKCQILAQAIAQSQHLVVYTGAGISTAAKIPDYRGTNGIWTRLQQGKDIGKMDQSAVSSDNINIDITLAPKKNAKRKADTSKIAMEVETHNGIEGLSINRPTKTKRVKPFLENMRKVPVPAHRYSPLKENWLKIFTPVVEHLQLQIRFNLKTRNVEIRTCNETKDIANLQKAADFVKAFIYGFEVEDSLALLRLDDLFVETFEIKDVKTLKGDHQSRAVGRLAGKGGRTKFTIENVTKTRIVLADTKIHILGSYQNIQLARRAICNLILGSPPSKVYGYLRNVVSRVSERI